MIVGQNRHDAEREILPRHFMKTAEISRAGASAVEAIFEDLVKNIEPAFAKVLNRLPRGFPEELMNLIRLASIRRVARLSYT